MRFSKTELKVLLQISLGKRQVSEVAEALDKDPSQIYRIIKNLEKKGYAELNKGIILPSENTHVNLLLQEISRRPNIINNLSGSGMKLFTTLLEPKSVSEIIKETGIKRSTIFYKLKEATKNSFINTVEEKYFFNEKIWPKVREFLVELKKHEETTDKRIPGGAVIYFKNKDEIIFSTKIECDAALTGFSAYENFGIKLLTVDYTYYLPKKTLTKNEVFLHSLYRAEKERDTRDFILIALFYLKHKNELADIKHEIIYNINKVLQGEKIKYYPSIAEIKDRADVYDIKI
jgi:predicted transcriptional regulator